jgi:NAD(P)-dependent dehydrogenase (short-subunit alcohol dehydrogenase family)
VGRLDGKIAIVTGGARGIGRAIVEKFALEGATVAVFDVLGDAGPPVDVTVDADVAAAVRRVEHEFGRVDVLVNNAGVNAYYDATTMTEAEWDRVFAVDLKARGCARSTSCRA